VPTYDYRCNACGHTWELFQSMSAKPVKACPSCGKKQAERLIGMGAAIVFKGSGFYQTDYRSEGYKKAAEADSQAAKGGTPIEAAKPASPAAGAGGEAGASTAGTAAAKTSGTTTSNPSAAPATDSGPKPAAANSKSTGSQSGSQSGAQSGPQSGSQSGARGRSGGASRGTSKGRSK